MKKIMLLAFVCVIFIGCGNQEPRKSEVKGQLALRSLPAVRSGLGEGGRSEISGEETNLIHDSGIKAPDKEHGPQGLEPNVETDEFDQKLKKVLALEQDAEFSAAMKLCRELKNTSGTHPDAAKLAEVMSRLRDERTTSMELPFAIKNLGSDKISMVQVARAKLISSGDAGRIFLRKALREEPVKISEQAAKILLDLKDEQSASLIIERLNRDPEWIQSTTVIEVLKSIPDKIDPEHISNLYQLVVRDSSYERRKLVGLLGVVLDEVALGHIGKFNNLVNDPKGYDFLRAYVNKALDSDDPELVAWACQDGVSFGSFVEKPFCLRNPNVRSSVLKRLGGSSETEACVKRALDWLASCQEADGHWSIAKFGGSAGHDVASTSFALLCYLGWGSSHTQPAEYHEHVSKAIKWLLSQLKPGGDLRGEGGNMYDQGVGTMALTEAYGITKDTNLLESAKSSVAFILSAQNKTTGGWRYSPGEDGDTSVFGFQVMALKSASLSGINVPDENLKLAEKWLDNVGGGEHGGLYGYTDKQPKPAMAAAGMICRQYLGMGPSEPKMQETAAYLNGSLPDKEKFDFYYWQYATIALFQHKGQVWNQWNTTLKEVLLSSQIRTGSAVGSWDPQGQWGDRCGRVVATAMAILSLEVYYRYPSIFGFTMTTR